MRASVNKKKGKDAHHGDRASRNSRISWNTIPTTKQDPI